MHERPLYYVFALFVALMVINLVSPVFGEDEFHTEEYITYEIYANNTFFDVTNPVSVNFTAIISGTSPPYLPEWYQWTIFEQNNPTYNVSPQIVGTQNWYEHTFTNPGLYGVKCIAYNGSWAPVNNHEHTERPFGYMTAYLPVSANFTNSTPTTGVLPLNVSFFSDNFTGGPNKWEWQYGTNNTTGNPGIIKFTSAGTFQINHTVWNTSYDHSADDSYKYKYGWVNSSVSNSYTIIGKQKVITNFSTDISTFTGQAKGQVPLSLNFYDNSTGDDINGWNWSFGDGRSSTTQHPTSIVYSTPGLFDVSLNTSSPWDDNLTTRTQYVNAYMPISANFSSASGGTCPPPAKQPFPVQYSFTTNATKVGESVPDVYNWSFDDGSVNDTRRNPTHQFNLPKAYNVTLTTRNLTHGIEISEMKVVPVIGLLANFTADPMIGYQSTTNQSVRVNFTYNATDVSSAASFHWDFGNGGSSNAEDTTVSSYYNRPGVYNVSLTIGNNCNQYNTTSKNITIIEYPVANFSYRPSYGNFPLDVHFNDTTTDSPNQWEWDFGDGSLHSTQQNPVHQYASSGEYLVNLKVKNTTVIPIQPSQITKKVLLSEGIVASFTSNLTRGVSPLSIQFNDTSQPSATVTNWSWNFGDNTPVSTQKDPVHTFYGANNYMVNLTVWNTTTGARGSTENNIEVVEPIYADFMPNRTARMNISEGVQFTDLSIGNVSEWHWDFGDGNWSDEQDPVNAFPEFKEYLVNLTVYNWYYDDINSVNYTVNVTEMRAPVADFSADPTTVNTQDIVIFAPHVQGPDIDSYLWDFGDGQTSTGTNPSHQYQLPGKYDVSLKITNPFGEDTATKSQYISVRGLIPSFMTVPAGWAVVNTPVTFIDTSKGSPVSWHWDFGDGTIDNPPTGITTHTFTESNAYTVNLTVTNWQPITASVSQQITIVNKTVPQAVDFEVPELQYSGKAPFEVQFEDKTPAQSNVVEWFWEFGDGTNSFEQAPMHRYETPGQYAVTLTVRNDAGTNDKRRVAYVVVI